MTIDWRSVQDTTDKALFDTIMNNSLIKAFLAEVFEKRLDQINKYVYSSSLVQLGENSLAVQALKRGCALFGVRKIPTVYRFRSYQFDVDCVGFDEPVILVPDMLLEQSDSRYLEGRMMACAASICASHHKLQFLNWILDNSNGIIPIPFASTAIRTLLHQWRRAQAFTCDNAFLAATNDYELAKNNILFGQVPESIFEEMSKSDHDPFENQVEDFFAMDGAADVISMAQALLSREIWLPERYKRLENYAKRRRTE